MHNSTFGKRLRASGSQPNLHDDAQPRRRRRRTSASSLSVPISDENSVESATSTPTRQPLADRFLPSGHPYTMHIDYGPGKDAVYSKKTKKGKCKENKSLLLNPTKVRANKIFKSVLGTELSPSRLPMNSQQMLSYRSPLQPTLPHVGPFGIPIEGSYSFSPSCSQTRHLLHNPPPPVRHIDSSPFRVLDAPHMIDDYYCNVLDWSSTNLIGVGLGSAAFIWHAATQKIALLCQMMLTPVSAVSWTQTGSTIAIGTSDGDLRVYDGETLQLIRLLPSAHEGRIGVLSWVGNVLSSGSRDGQLQHRDFRDSSYKPFKQCIAHKNEVCGLKWSGDDIATANLASGGNDNRVCIWDLRGSSRATRLGSEQTTAANVLGKSTTGDDKPVWKFREHKAAVKALAWNPHINGVLATGGGSRDNHIQFWNTATGKMLSEIDTGGQVCNLLWSRTSPEIVSTHGHSAIPTARNQIRVWKYPSLELQTSLIGHTSRVLYLAMSPDGQSIVTGSGDQTLRFWNVFPRLDEGQEKRDQSVLDYGQLIR